MPPRRARGDVKQALICFPGPARPREPFGKTPNDGPAGGRRRAGTTGRISPATAMGKSSNHGVSPGGRCRGDRGSSPRRVFGYFLHEQKVTTHPTTGRIWPEPLRRPAQPHTPPAPGSPWSDSAEHAAWSAPRRRGSTGTPWLPPARPPGGRPR